MIQKRALMIDLGFWSLNKIIPHYLIFKKYAKVKRERCEILCYISINFHRRKGKNKNLEAKR